MFISYLYPPVIPMWNPQQLNQQQKREGCVSSRSLGIDDDKGGCTIRYYVYIYIHCINNIHIYIYHIIIYDLLLPHIITYEKITYCHLLSPVSGQRCQVWPRCQRSPVPSTAHQAPLTWWSCEYHGKSWENHGKIIGKSWLIRIN